MTTMERSTRPERAVDDVPSVDAGRLRTRRQPKWIAAGVLAICLGGLGATLLYSEAVGSRDVVVVNRAVPRGQQIGQADVRVTKVGSVPGVSVVEGDQLGTLIGRTALVDLPPGSLLPQGAVGAPSLPQGFAEVGLRLAPGRLPIGQLSQGTPVRLIPLEDPRLAPGDPGAARPQPIAAVVAGPPRPGNDGVSTLVDIRVPQGMAPTVATLAATDRLAVVVEGMG